MDLSFRPLLRGDFPLLQRWLAEPHVERWWREPSDAASIEKKYGPRIDGKEPSHVFVIAGGGKPIGLIQWYRWSDYPRHATQLGAGENAFGIDLAIGETEAVDKGWGTRAIRQFVQEVGRQHPELESCVVDPEQENQRSLRAFAKAGFVLERTVNLQGEEVFRKVLRTARPF